MYKIAKEFNFCYGHRVHNQSLHSEALGAKCKCRHLHGHNGKVRLTLMAKEIENGMVTDFNNLKGFEKIIDMIFDHKFIIDINDPHFERITGVDKPILKRFDDARKFRYFPFSDEHLSSFTIVDFVPTSENICKALFDLANEYFFNKGLDVSVSKVEFFETDKTSCEYTSKI